jgi:hypothetical protein
VEPLSADPDVEPEAGVPPPGIPEVDSPPEVEPLLADAGPPEPPIGADGTSGELFDEHAATGPTSNAVETAR